MSVYSVMCLASAALICAGILIAVMDLTTLKMDHDEYSLEEEDEP